MVPVSHAVYSHDLHRVQHALAAYHAGQSNATLSLSPAPASEIVCLPFYSSLSLFSPFTYTHWLSLSLPYPLLHTHVLLS